VRSLPLHRVISSPDLALNRWNDLLVDVMQELRREPCRLEPAVHA
jgi:hypothetical protein